MQSEQVCDKETDRTNNPAVEDTAAAKKHKKWPTRVRTYEAAYIKFGFTARQENSHDVNMLGDSILIPNTSENCK